MELLEGRTLKLEVSIEVADALGAAHSAGMIHREIKSGNWRNPRQRGSSAYGNVRFRVGQR